MTTIYNQAQAEAKERELLADVAKAIVAQKAAEQRERESRDRWLVAEAENRGIERRLAGARQVYDRETDSVVLHFIDASGQKLTLAAIQRSRAQIEQAEAARRADGEKLEKAAGALHRAQKQLEHWCTSMRLWAEQQAEWDALTPEARHARELRDAVAAERALPR